MVGKPSFRRLLLKANRRGRGDLCPIGMSLDASRLEASDALQEPSLMPAVTEGEFDDFLGSSSGFVLVDFWADWCGPCQQASPILEALAEEYEGRVAFCKVNADQSPRLSKAFGVRSLPTILGSKTVRRSTWGEGCCASYWL